MQVIREEQDQTNASKGVFTATSVGDGSLRPAVVGLDDSAAVDQALVGAKAAALAKAAARGLPVLPGFVLTTTASAVHEGVAGDSDLGPHLARVARSRWVQLSDHGKRSLIVRSSSTVEDGAHSSMAGMFTSVPCVRTWGGFVEAVAIVLDSRKAVPGIEDAPMAVLVQPQLEARVGGVLFGADPMSGRTDRLVVAAAEGTPERLVSGEVDAGALSVVRARTAPDGRAGPAGPRPSAAS